MEKVEMTCKQCNQRLRVPVGLGNLTLTCPKCRHTWDTTDEAKPKPRSNALVSTLYYENDDAFYTRLAAMEKAGERFTVETPFTKYEELPERLKRIFSVEDKTKGRWVNADGEFVRGAAAPATFNRSALVIGGMTATGAGIGAGGGALFGGIGAVPGVLAGAMAGLIAGAVSVVLAERKHTLMIEVDVTTGRLRFEFHPITEATQPASNKAADPA